MKKEEKKVETKKVSTKKETVKKTEKTNNEGIFKKVQKYFKGVVKETKRIKWTSGKELVKYSIAAIVFVVFFGIYFYGIDWLALLVRSLAK